MRERSTDIVYCWYHLIILPNLACHCGVDVNINDYNKGEEYNVYCTA
jgi:hypothetical protein